MEDRAQFPLARDEVRRRVRAARALAGLTVAELAQHELVVTNGLTVSTIGETERGSRDAKPMELEVLARACGLRPDWFTVPLDHLGDPETAWIALARRVARIEQALDISRPGGEDRTRPANVTPMTDALRFTICYSDGGEGWIMAHVEQVPGAISQGRTRPEARENVIDALRLMLKPELGETADPDRESLDLPVS